MLQKDIKNINGVSFFSSFSDRKEAFDLVISRHVLEHVPKQKWGEYLSELRDLLKIGGEILIDVPNQNNPREPHTELLFFHLLSEELKHNILEYCETTNPAWFSPIKDIMKALINHENVRLESILESLPENLTCEKTEFIDINCDSYNESYTDGIRVILKRKN